MHASKIDWCMHAAKVYIHSISVPNMQAHPATQYVKLAARSPNRVDELRAFFKPRSIYYK